MPHGHHTTAVVKLNNSQVEGGLQTARPDGGCSMEDVCTSTSLAAAAAAVVLAGVLATHPPSRRGP
jgi:hypothetical protein